MQNDSKFKINITGNRNINNKKKLAYSSFECNDSTFYCQDTHNKH